MNLCAGGDPTKPNAVRWCTKPIERRTLYQPTSKFSQGILECYLDIMETGLSNFFEIDRFRFIEVCVV